MKTTTVTNTESAIWDRLLQPAGQTLTVAAARSLLKLDFPTPDKDRMHTLQPRHETARSRQANATKSANTNGPVTCWR